MREQTRSLTIPHKEQRMSTVQKKSPKLKDLLDSSSTSGQRIYVYAPDFFANYLTRLVEVGEHPELDRDFSPSVEILKLSQSKKFKAIIADWDKDYFRIQPTVKTTLTYKDLLVIFAAVCHDPRYAYVELFRKHKHVHATWGGATVELERFYDSMHIQPYTCRYLESVVKSQPEVKLLWSCGSSYRTILAELASIKYSWLHSKHTPRISRVGSLMNLEKLKIGSEVILPVSRVCSHKGKVDNVIHLSLEYPISSVEHVFESLPASDGKGDWTRRVETTSTNRSSNPSRAHRIWEVAHVGWTGGCSTNADGLCLKLSHRPSRELLTVFVSGDFNNRIDPRHFIICK